MDGNEIELKLAMAPEAMSKLKRLPALRQMRSGPAVTKSLRSVYYDTPNHDLARAGISARLRHGARGQIIQTVKTVGNRTSGLFSRREWECEVERDGLDHAQLAATGLKPLADNTLLAELTPVFATEIQRSIHDLHGDGWQVELAMDMGVLRAGERSEAICEVELELKTGEARHLFALARQIAATVPVRLLALSKSDRGYDLAAGRGPDAVKAKPVSLDRGLTAADAFQAIANNCLHHLLANQQPLLECGDGEAVHQMRVALRRLRSAMKIFRPLLTGPHVEALRTEMRWLLSYLGPARDADVFLAEIVEPVAARHPEQTGMTALRQHWQEQKAADVAAARVAVGESRFSLLMLDLGAWVEAGEWRDNALARQPLPSFAGHVLTRLTRKLRKAGGKKLDRLSPPALHQVRIRGKQLRYATEFFASLYGKAARGPVAQLGELQDRLGQINDIAVAVPRLATCHHLGEAAWAAGMVAGWHEARRPDLLAKAQAVWSRWRKQPDFWTA